MASTNGKWIRQKDSLDNIATCVANVFSLLGVRYTFAKIDENLKSHPDYPSLLAVAETVPDWGVDTQAVIGTVDELSDEDYPSIAHTRADDFIVIANVDTVQKQVSLIDTRRGRVSLSLEEFAKLWSGVILRILPLEDAGEPEYEANLKKDRRKKAKSLSIYAGFGALGSLAFAQGVMQSPDPVAPSLLGVLHLLGFLTCVVMVIGSITRSRIIQTMCRPTKQVNCQGVMNSKAGRIAGVPMSDLGLLYFAGGILSLHLVMLSGRVDEGLHLLALISLLPLPYTIFSVVYQGLVIRTWCWMCLFVMALFWSELYVLSDYMEFVDLPLDPESLLPLALGFGIPVLTWTVIRPMIAKASQTRALVFALRRYRRDPVYIGAKLASGAAVDMGRFGWELELGPVDAGTTITAVVHPTCIHCFRAYMKVKDALEWSDGRLKVRFRFSIWVPDPDEVNDIDIKAISEKRVQAMDYNVSVAIIANLLNGSRERALTALDEWYSTTDRSEEKFERWKMKFVLDDETANMKARALLSQQYAWGRRAGVKGTPTLFYGDREIPLDIKLDDMKSFVLQQN